MICFIHAERSGLIKIGKANQVYKRLQTLQTGSPEKLRVLMMLPTNAEKTYHIQFADSRVHGEWFQPSDTLLNFIHESLSNYPLDEIIDSDVRFTCNLCEKFLFDDDCEGWDTDTYCRPCMEKMRATQ